MTEAPHRVSSLNVLVVDDERHIRTTLTVCIEGEGHRVEAASSAQEALQVAAREVLDVVFLDLRLGTASGLDLIQHPVLERAVDARPHFVRLCPFDAADREAKRLKELEQENARLKKLLAEQMLDAATLREMLAKNF